MLKPRKQNRMTKVKRHVANTPYFGYYLYRGKSWRGKWKVRCAPPVAFWPTGIGHIILMDEQGNPIKGESENVKTA
ncbi:hypothetical protein BIZ83_gp140 [Erwinia phage vB_EamM_ChrisDB]|uniref:hypothetical protein n=1 Tax=Erwinia phage vB_EamM_ChrisDB TaxID=1883371 RepID=UPI00081C96E5|nr:hypothetical protein BIZ83_gp140 [Erwinia phage vB_EamM_ChrisDB]ANZ48713.1 hypothetical protein CHRISDB_151 [Erwinia phage vB_EamM_ChrisDB]